jgi:tetratricopeptide (TPR) repeat protein
VLSRSLANQPYEEQRARLRTCRFHTREFIDLLGEQYLIASRANRQRGVEVAELAVLSVETSAEALGAAAHDLRALAYAWVANAKRLAVDYDGADEAITEAEKAWATPCEARDPGVGAEIVLFKGSLRFNQRRFEEAVDLLNHAIKESRLAGAMRVLAQALLLRACVIDYARLPAPVLPDLQQALRALQDLDEPRLTVGTHMILGYSYIVAGQYAHALKEVTQAWALWAEIPESERDPLLPPLLRWNEGLARHGLGELAAAGDLYEESRAALIALGEIDHAAVVALDLARLRAEQGRCCEVSALPSEALAVLEELRIPEAVEALNLLRGALETSMVTARLLERVRAALVTSRWLPPTP